MECKEGIGNGAVGAPQQRPPRAELPTISVQDFDLDLAHLGQDQIAALYTKGLHVIVAIITPVLAILRGVLQENQGRELVGGRPKPRRGTW